MNRTAQLQSQVKNLEAQNARIVQDMDEAKRQLKRNEDAVYRYEPLWVAAEKQIEELEGDAAQDQIDLSNARDRVIELEERVKELLIPLNAPHTAALQLQAKLDKAMAEVASPQWRNPEDPPERTKTVLVLLGGNIIFGCLSHVGDTWLSSYGIKIRTPDKWMPKPTQAKLDKAMDKVYSWCNRCGSLVVGDINHPCDKCGNHDLTSFVVDVELVKLQTQLKATESMRSGESVVNTELQGQLDKAMAELASHPWISVKDRLPGDGPDEQRTCEWKHGDIMVLHGDDKDTTKESVALLGGGVTHWIPKPGKYEATASEEKQAELRRGLRKAVEDKYKSEGATFLRECKWRDPKAKCQRTITRSFGGPHYGKLYGQPCDKNCKHAEKETK